MFIVTLTQPDASHRSVMFIAVKISDPTLARAAHLLSCPGALLTRLVVMQ